jgi:glutamyl-tRNA reductase
MRGQIQEESLQLVGISYRTASVDLRERLAFQRKELPRALGHLKGYRCQESIILSTCNRVEVIAVKEPASNSETTANDSFTGLRKFLIDFHGIPEQEFKPFLYEYKGARAAQHVFEVISSLDSLVLGETEIVAQAREAYRVAQECGTCMQILHRLFERAFHLSKELRSDGGIGRSKASVSSAAVLLARKIFDLQNREVLVIGTGEMAAGIVRTLHDAGVSRILVASRTAERAAEFAEREGCTPCDMQRLVEHLASVDIVLVSSACPTFVIVPEHIKAASVRRRGRPICLIDISVPRNVDPAVQKLENTFLFDIDDLEAVANEGKREREAVAARWRPRLAHEAHIMLRNLQNTDINAGARVLVEHFAELRDSFVEEYSGEMDAQSVKTLNRALEVFQGRLLHGPLEGLRCAARQGDGSEALEWIERLFRLPRTSPNSSELKSTIQCKS